VAWIVAGAAVLFFGRVFRLLTDVSAYDAGRILGAIGGAAIVGVAARWFVVKVRHRGRVISPWILVVAAFVLLIGLVRQPSYGAATGGVPIGSYVQINPPYALAMPTPDEAEQVRTLLARAKSGAHEVRGVLEGDELIGYFVIADLAADSSAQFRRGMEEGFEANEGAEAHEALVGGRSAVVGTGPTGAAVAWVEPPFALTVYSNDVQSAEALAAAIMAAYE
jgi:hypothetical protein